MNKETRSERISARVSKALLSKMNKEIKKRKWSLSDLVEESLINFLNEKA
jgi:hypothetical protein